MSRGMCPFAAVRALILTLSVSYGAVAFASLYVSNAPGSGDASVASWQNDATGNVTPNTDIVGASTDLFVPEQIAVDPTWLYVANWGNSNVIVFPRLTSGNVQPSHTIAGSLTTLSGPQGIATDANFIYIADWSTGSVVVFPIGATGNVTPTRIISGAATLLNRPNELAVDASFIYVANGGGNNILVFPLGANGNVAPIRVISGPATTLAQPYGLAIDSASIYVGNSSGNSILIFPLAANGNTPPASTISGAATTLSLPGGVAVDSSSIYVANYGRDTVLTFPVAANGNMAPTTTISGAATGLNGPIAVAVAPATVVSCPANGGGGDRTDRGFYVTDYGAGTLGTVTLQYFGASAGTYTVSLTANNGTYNGPLIGTATVTAAVASAGDTPLPFNFGVAVAPGSTIAFTQSLVSGPDSLFFDTGTGPCAGVTETNGTTPPLDMFRRNSVALMITDTANYEGLWWASPAGSESGWGINFAHQGGIIFATWFTYDLTGKGWWLVMTAPEVAPGVYSGALYTTTGPAFNAVPFNPTQVTATQVGTGTLTFADANDGTFAYTVNGITQTKNVTREVFGPLPGCATAVASLASATNYQDLWWAAPAGSESGWGINLTQEGQTIFGTWFTYDLDHTPMWLVVTAPQTAPGVFSGTLYRTTGPPFNAVPFNPTDVAGTAVGTATFTFSDGNDASFAYTVNGVSQVKAITREVFQTPGTVCQ